MNIKNLHMSTGERERQPLASGTRYRISVAQPAYTTNNGAHIEVIVVGSSETNSFVQHINSNYVAGTIADIDTLQ